MCIVWVFGATPRALETVVLAEQLEGQGRRSQRQAQPSPPFSVQMPVKKAEQKRAQSRRGQIQAMGSGKQAEALRFRAD